MKARTVGLVGWYWRGNFGDDLMAVLFALRLRKMGYRPVVWQLSGALAAEYGLEACADLDQLVAQSDAVVYGGGGLFTDAHRRMEAENGFGEAMERLCSRVLAKGIPLALSSVGGDGEATGLSRPQLALLQAASLVTLRNEEDRAWAARHGKDARVHADVVWRAPIELGLSARAARRQVLIHQAGRLERLAVHAAVAIRRLCGLRTSAREVRCERARPGEAAAGTLGYSSLRAMLLHLADTRLVLTNRLHLAMAALSLGGSVLALRPEAKCRLVWARVGLGSAIVDGRRAWVRSAAGVLGSSAHRAGLRLTDVMRQQLAADADQHFLELDRFLRRAAAAAQR